MPCSTRLHRSTAGLAAALALLCWIGCQSGAPAAPNTPSDPPLATSPAAVAPAVPSEAATSAPAGVPPPASPAAPTPPYRNTIRWTTASEVDSFGFDVFRGDSADGLFVRLNAKPIAGAGTSDESHSYAWVDETIDPAKEYYYYVESISIDGVREKFTPVNRARAKLPSPAIPAP